MAAASRLSCNSLGCHMAHRCLLAVMSFALLAGCGGKTLDKDGGVILVYQLAEKGAMPPATVATAIRQRLSHLAGRGQLEVKALDDGKFEVTLIGVSDEELKSAKEMLRANGALEFRIVALRGEDDELIAAAEEGMPVKDKTRPHARWVSYDPERCTPPEKAVTKEEDGKKWMLVIDDELDVTAQTLDYVSPRMDENGWQLEGSFNPEGAALMQQLTKRNLPQSDKRRQLAVVFDGEAISAPSIQGEIKGKFQITGKFTEDEVRLMAAVLKAGKFPAKLKPEPVSEKKVPPKP
jgi:preprotein translocase subunit SecD